MDRKKAVEIMTSLQAEYFYAFKDMPEKLFVVKVKNLMEALDGYTDQEIDVALKILLKESETCPTSAHFVEIIERNRDLSLSTPEEEWAKVNKVRAEMVYITSEYFPGCDINAYFKKKKTEYNKLSDEVKEFYVDYDGFCSVVNSNKLEIEKNRFLKNFPLFRGRKKQKKELDKLLGDTK